MLMEEMLDGIGQGWIMYVDWGKIGLNEVFFDDAMLDGVVLDEARMHELGLGNVG